MQEELTHKSIALTTRAAKLTKDLLVKMITMALRKMKQQRSAPHHGKQTVKQLTRLNSGLQTMEITNENIKSFERVARKYGVDYSLRRDSSMSPPKWVVFFRSRDSDALMAAFKEFTAKAMKRGKDKPSVLEALRQKQRQLKAPAEPVRYKQQERAL